MKNIAKIMTAVVALTIASAASAGPGYHGNYVGAVPPVGNVVYAHQPYYGHQPYVVQRSGCGSNCVAAVVLGTVAGAVIVNEMRRQPEVVYVPTPVPAPQPKWVYVQSDPRFACDNGAWINVAYFCPRLVP